MHSADEAAREQKRRVRESLESEWQRDAEFKSAKQAGSSQEKAAMKAALQAQMAKASDEASEQMERRSRMAQALASDLKQQIASHNNDPVAERRARVQAAAQKAAMDAAEQAAEVEVSREKREATKADLLGYNAMQSQLTARRKEEERDAEKQQARRANERVADEAARMEAEAAMRKQALASDMMGANNARMDEMRRQKDAEMAAKKRELEAQSDFAFSEARHHGEGDSNARKAAYRKEVEEQIQSQAAIKAAQKAAERAGNVGTGLSMVPSEENRAAGNYFDREAYKHELDDQISARDGTKRDEALRAKQIEREAADVVQRQMRAEQEAEQMHKHQVS
jgi:hypothetical protein